MVHVMEARGLKVHSSTYLEDLVASFFVASGKSLLGVVLTFQRQLETAFEGPVVVEIFEGALGAKRPMTDTPKRCCIHHLDPPCPPRDATHSSNP